MPSTKSRFQKPEEKILAAAGREFARFGLAGARVDRIAAQAGINKAMLYYYFRSKENLYQAVINQQLSKIRSLAEEIISSEANPEELLMKLAEVYQSMFENRENMVPIILREIASGGERIKKDLKRIMTTQRLGKKVKEIIERGKREGMFRDVDPRQAIISFIGMNLFYLIMEPIVNSVWDIKDRRKFRKERPREIVDLFLHGIETK
jgi:AcrR family transcriptional regulator